MHRFAGRDVLVVSNGLVAREAMVVAWSTAASSGRRTLLVASDDAVVHSLRDSVQSLGGSRDDVVESRRLAAVLSGQRSDSGVESRIVVLGGLPSGVKDARVSDCVHVTVVPAHQPEVYRLGRAAEVARPRYLLSELGPVLRDPSGRATWRKGAVVIENLRRRLSIGDPDRALGDRRTLRSREAVGDLAEARLELGRALRSIERAGPTATTARNASAGTVSLSPTSLPADPWSTPRSRLRLRRNEHSIQVPWPNTAPHSS